jgi:hypothetical protein
VRQVSPGCEIVFARSDETLYLVARDALAPRDVVRSTRCESNRPSFVSSQESVMPKHVSTVIVEIRAAEGGADAKLLVEEQIAIYTRLASRRLL